jgi:Co/Zn/Cd efflux system component
VGIIEITTEYLRVTVKSVAAFNFGYFWVEFTVAVIIGSVALFADSVDFLEDASVHFLIAVALGWPARKRARVGMALAALILVPAVAALWTAWEKFNVPAPPAPLPLTITGFGALVVNFGCAYMLARFRDMAGSLTKAAFLYARNDAYANLAIILAGLATLWTTSAWPDLAVGLGIAVMNAGAAFEVWEAARKESRAEA